jgi:hypothetical protein
LRLEIDLLVLAAGPERRKAQGFVERCDHVSRLQRDILPRVLNDGFEGERVHTCAARDLNGRLADRLLDARRECKCIEQAFMGGSD